MIRAASFLLCIVASAQVSLITTGIFHAGEVKVRNGERWLALVPSSAGFSWRTVNISVRYVVDPVGDSLVKDAPDVSVRGVDPLFLLKGADYLAGKAVRTALFSPDGLSVPDKGALNLTCASCGGVYTLRLSAPRAEEFGVAHKSQLLLELNGVAEILYEWPEGLVDQACELVWAGDLDGDGKMDFFFDLNATYNSLERTLFMSSKSRRLVEKVAVLSITGC